MRKLTILFSMQYEAGHIISSFKLAKKLCARGHTVIYMTIEDFRPLIENQGYTVIVFAKDIMPQGYSKLLDTKYHKNGNETVYKQYLQKITDGTLDRCLLSAAPDILICDPFLSYVAIRAVALGIPAVNLFTSLFAYENPDIPPVILNLQQRHAFITALAWKYIFLKFFFTKKIKNIITREFQFPSRMHHLVDVYRGIARQSEFPCIKDKTYRINEIGFNIILPEIMLCTKAFQFPGDIPPQRMYAGNFVDLERKEVQIDLRLDDRPLVYCSLGTAACAYPHADKFYAAVVEASRQREDWRFVLQMSDAKKIGNYRATDNLSIAKWVPQLHLLQKAAVMVTHGGLNSIMECVCCEVPMVIVPALRDQPGNAARAKYHHLARTLGMKHLDAAKLLTALEDVMRSDCIRNGLRAMHAAIQREDELGKCIDAIERIATRDAVTPNRQQRAS